MDYGELLLFFGLGYALGVGYESFLVKYTNKKDLVIHGYVFHHSLLGAVLLALGTIYYGFGAVGLGLIIHHIRSEGFLFITKEQKIAHKKTSKSPTK